MKNTICKGSMKIVLSIFMCFTHASYAQDGLQKPTQAAKPSNCEDFLYQLDKAMYANVQNENKN